MLRSRGMDGVSSNTRIVSALNVARIVLAVLSVAGVALLVMDMIPRKKDSTC